MKNKIYGFIVALLIPAFQLIEASVLTQCGALLSSISNVETTVTAPPFELENMPAGTKYEFLGEGFYGIVFRAHLPGGQVKVLKYYRKAQTPGAGLHPGYLEENPRSLKSDFYDLQYLQSREQELFVPGFRVAKTKLTSSSNVMEIENIYGVDFEKFLANPKTSAKDRNFYLDIYNRSMERFEQDESASLETDVMFPTRNILVDLKNRELIFIDPW